MSIDLREAFNDKYELNEEARAALVEEEASLRAQDKARRAELKVKLAAIRKLLRSGREPKAA